MKKKITIIIPSLRGGGAERFILNIIRLIDRNKFDVTLIVIKIEGCYVEILPEDINVIDLNINRARQSLVKLIKTIKEIFPDVILSTLGHLNLVFYIVRPFLSGD